MAKVKILDWIWEWFVVLPVTLLIIVIMSFCLWETWQERKGEPTITISEQSTELGTVTQMPIKLDTGIYIIGVKSSEGFFVWVLVSDDYPLAMGQKIKFRNLRIMSNQDESYDPVSVLQNQ